MQELEMENMYQKAYIRVKCFKGLFTHDISNLFHTISNSLELCQMLLKEGIETEEILEYFILKRKFQKNGSIRGITLLFSVTGDQKFRYRQSSDVHHLLKFCTCVQQCVVVASCYDLPFFYHINHITGFDGG